MKLAHRSRHLRRERLTRWGATIAAVVIAVAWVGTIFAHAIFDFGPWSVSLSYGALALRHYPADPPIPLSFKLHAGFSSARDRAQFWTGPEWYRPNTFRFSGRNRHWSIPLWLPCAPFAFIAVRSWRRHRHCVRSSIFCQACGYDLRGLAIAATCPECGSMFPPNRPPVSSVPSAPPS